MDAAVESGGGGAARLLSLDAFRGATIAGMILVNNPGSWSHIYWPLRHAEWHGWTPTDWVFPFFLFIVGVSITLALSRRAESGGSKRDLYRKIARRTLVIFALGLLLSGFPFFDLSTIRATGVLNRIAVCYFFAAIIFLKTDWRKQLVIAAALLVGYWAILALVPAPGYAAGDLSKEGSVVSFVDRKLLGNHIWKGGGRVYDPEGILSTLPAIATTLCGVLAGHWMRRARGDYEKVAGMFAAGVACVIAGWAWNPWLPINKPLWTSSYVLFTAGWALLLLALCYWLIDIKGFKRWALPFVVFGVNALAVFVLTGLVARAMTLREWWNLPRADGTRGATLQGYLYQNLFASWLSPVNASLAYAVCFVLVWLGLMAILYRKKIFIKV
ncbi:MAG TPA: heparan-alpha-glucosaminide N-acetyltransferase domain-containing protein [Pyrinomonadaceae bacterium]|nr:heparan-alpha-glucosaminide N-acetyltransferase domain-containing protein [Pyrinomonadaceae bacterium]